MAEPDIYVANRTAVFQHDGRRVRITKGQTTVRRGHPIMEGREQLFDPFTVEYDTVTRVAGGSDRGITHVGGGYYQLPNGERVQGRDDAERRLAELDAGE